MTFACSTCDDGTVQGRACPTCKGTRVVVRRWQAGLAAPMPN